MIISLIVAMERRGGIGKDNQLPWRLPADLKRFRALTLGHHVIVGRKTYESILAITGKPLPGRTMIVVTRNRTYNAPHCLITHTLTDALALARACGEQEVFVIGGAELYAQALPLAERIYLTQVHTEVTADTFFPPLAAREWQIIASEHHAADEKNEFAMTFQQLQRR